MSARKAASAGKARRPAPKRPTARKPRTIEVAGHELSPELYLDYGRAIVRRQDTNRGAPQGSIEQMALEDVLANFRPTHTAKDQLRALYGQFTSVAFAMMALADYPFFDSRATAVRVTGCDALNRLAAQAQFLGAKIAAIGDAMRHEHREKLQDWQKRQAAIDAASAYGAAPEVQP
jgi:hypothetical protein